MATRKGGGRTAAATITGTIVKEKKPQMALAVLLVETARQRYVNVALISSLRCRVCARVGKD